MHNFHTTRLVSAVLMLFSCGAALSTATASVVTHNGDPLDLGNGTVNTYLTLKDGKIPVAIGIRMTASALEGLPKMPNNTSRCFDMNGDGKFEAGVECLGDYEFTMNWPKEIEEANLPFKWMGLNWNAHGHNPKTVYDLPHFDVHFYVADTDLIASIRTGACGEWTDCEDFERARVPVPAQFLPVGHVDVGAVAAQMGNHLINTASPELLTPPQRFTHTLIYGAYDGQITFMEPMVTREFLLTRPDLCAPISQPAAWQKPANYPTQYCIRYLPDEAALTISLERFSASKMALEMDEKELYEELS